MKNKWIKLFAFLGITDVQSSADGVFMKEEDIDKFAKMEEDFNSMKSENEELKGKVSGIDASIQEAVSAATKPLTDEIESLKDTNEQLSASLESTQRELATALGKETVATGKKDPEINSSSTKKKQTPNERAAELNAAALRGERFDHNEADEITEAVVSARKTKENQQ